jgi:hypothetical protein
VGQNIIASGNVLIRLDAFIVKADKAIVNVQTRDLEAVGNVVFIERNESKSSVSLLKYHKMVKEGYQRVRIDGFSVTPVGERLLNVTVFQNGRTYKGHKVVGNMTTGALEFQDFSGKVDMFYLKGKYATRNAAGVIELTDADLSTCDYLLEDHAHFSLAAGTVKIFPYKKEGEKGFSGYNVDIGDHSIWAYNCTYKVMGVPVLWLPVMYKPKDENWGLFKIQVGNSSDFGYYVSVSKYFDGEDLGLWDYPATSTRLMATYYSKRGLALGNETKIRTENSYTEFFYYGLKDRDRYKSFGDSDDDKNQEFLNSMRMRVHKYRYDLRLSHLNHLTPRLDFRGHYEKISDFQFLEDYFDDDYENNPQPATFAALEYQFDRFSASLYVRPRVNDFYTVVEKLPEFRIDVPRQELFHNIYYQSETSFSNLSMRWRNYDRPRITGNGIDPTDYSTFRFDTLHMFYYPLKFFDALNIIPRAGARVTVYSNTPKNKINEEQLGEIFLVDEPDGHQDGNVVNYETSGRWKIRLAGELGLEMNTKISRAWNNVKNAFWQLDGFRHVAVPYINYTFIPSPNFSPTQLYYFDDIDRISKQNFIRFGVTNRIETRSGSYGNESIYEWMSLENYIDYHFQKKNGFNNMGDFGTIFTFTPANGLSISSNLLIDAGGNNDHDTTATRAGRDAGRPYMSNNWINRWETSISYAFWEDFKIYGTYNYHDAYKENSVYSMGSTLTDIMSGSGFIRNYGGRYQSVKFGAQFPIPIDDKTKGTFELQYDIDKGYMRNMKAGLKRSFHCWEMAVEYEREIERDWDQSKIFKSSIMLAFYLKAIPALGLKQSQKQSAGGASGVPGGN